MPVVGLEPTRMISPQDFESSASASFTTPAQVIIYHNQIHFATIFMQKALELSSAFSLSHFLHNFQFSFCKPYGYNTILEFFNTICTFSVLRLLSNYANFSTKNSIMVLRARAMRMTPPNMPALFLSFSPNFLPKNTPHVQMPKVMTAISAKVT